MTLIWPGCILCVIYVLVRHIHLGFTWSSLTFLNGPLDIQVNRRVYLYLSIAAIVVIQAYIGQSILVKPVFLFKDFTLAVITFDTQLVHGTGLWLGTPLDYLHKYLTYIMFAYQSLHFKASFYFLCIGIQ